MRVRIWTNPSQNTVNFIEYGIHIILRHFELYFLSVLRLYHHGGRLLGDGRLMSAMCDEVQLPVHLRNTLIIVAYWPFYHFQHLGPVCLPKLEHHFLLLFVQVIHGFQIFSQLL